MSVSDLKSSNICKVQEIKSLSGGVVMYAAQSNAQIDAELAEKGVFQRETQPGAASIRLAASGRKRTDRRVSVTCTVIVSGR